jgi:hypothetical protein
VLDLRLMPGTALGVRGDPVRGFPEMLRVPSRRLIQWAYGQEVFQSCGTERLMNPPPSVMDADPEAGADTRTGLSLGDLVPNSALHSPAPAN